jgi:hypothetical protein
MIERIGGVGTMLRLFLGALGVSPTKLQLFRTKL